jgi:hypothetical protein
MGPMDNVPFAPLFERDPRLAIGATFAIASGANHSTLVTITFPTRLLPRA